MARTVEHHTGFAHWDQTQLKDCVVGIDLFLWEPLAVNINFYEEVTT